MVGNVYFSIENKQNSTRSNIYKDIYENYNITLQNEECIMCNGFYEPCFGDPICATCHSFLFPDCATQKEYFEIITEKSDDGDSGNDEPLDGTHMDKKGINLDEQFIRDSNSPTISLDNLISRLEMLSLFHSKTEQKLSNIHINNLPTEVLLVVFSYLDDFSLWNVANVCKRWKTLIIYEVPNTIWEELTFSRFPLFKPIFLIKDWFQLYTNLMNNCMCFLCIEQMAEKTELLGEEGSWRRNRLRNELKVLRSDPPEGIQAVPLDPPMCCHWQATILGPVGSPYEGGVFLLYIQVPYNYPMCPPIVRFLTKIFHPNISRHGDVGIDSIHYNWSLALTLSKVLISVQSLLTDPYCEVCMEPEIGKLYLTDQSKFEMIAQLWTWRYAMHDFIR